MSFWSNFTKRKGSIDPAKAIAKYIAPKRKTLPNFDEVVDAVNSSAAKKILGVTGGGIATGAAVGALSVKEKTSPEEEKRLKAEQARLKKEFASKPFMERYWGAPAHKKDLIKSETSTQKKWRRGLMGADLGFMVGGALSQIPTQKAVQLTKALKHIADHNILKHKGGLSVPEEVRLDIFKKAKDVIKNDKTPIVIGGVKKTPSQFYDKIVENIEARRAKRVFDHTWDSSIFSMFNKSPFQHKPDPHAEAYEGLFMNRIHDKWRSNESVNTSKVAPLLEKLKNEGITNSRQFAAKYHPDVNKKIPKDYREQFGNIVEALRGSKEEQAPTDMMDTFVQKLKKQHDPEVAKVYDMAEKFHGKKL